LALLIVQIELSDGGSLSRSFILRLDAPKDLGSLA
jgi:hypothetical protein